MNISSIIQSILTLFGITQVPTTVSEFLWCIVIIVVGLWVVKYCMLFIMMLFKAALKIG